MNEDKEIQIAQIKGRTAIITAIIRCIAAIIAAIIGIFSININIENHDLLKKNELLLSENINLKEINNNLQNKIDNLIKENELLNTGTSTGINNSDDSNSVKNSENKSISIFDLETFNGEGGWHKSTNEIDYTDTYDNKYIQSYWGNHYSISKDVKSCPTYFLDKKYSKCKGQIVWSKGSKNIEGSAWIDFYSDDTCIYTTEVITSDSKIINFSFDVTEVDKLTIVRNSTKDMNDWDTVHIIYPYLNLIP